ncbi:MAG TPA: sensor histidine kinase [Gaiellaceae bacterium]|jgi:signal transduction histidine kinase|nr:sensor histidine kinase [Gaiellaceae bacterium]
MRIARPRTSDVLFALAGAAVLTGDAVHRHSGSAGVAVAFALLACAPLAWSSRRPLTALLGTAAGLLVCLAVFQPYDTAVFVLAVALYHVASLGDRRRSLIVGTATATFLVTVIMIIASDNVARNTGIRLGVALGALVIGDTVRSRRELREARRERDLRIAHEREQESLRRVADERLRVARDLHDTVAHALVAINVRAGVAAHLHASDNSDGALTDIMAVSAQALNDLRTTLSLLRGADDPAPTTPHLDLAAIAELLERAKAAGLEVDAHVALDDQAIPIAVEQAGFRIVQEALTNVMRHAGASQARVSLHVDAEVLHIDVTDNGPGALSEPSATDGHGLRGMNERAAALGGHVSAGRAGRGGWQVHAQLPLTHGKR